MFHSGIFNEEDGKCHCVCPSVSNDGGISAVGMHKMNTKST